MAHTAADRLTEEGTQGPMEPLQIQAGGQAVMIRIQAMVEVAAVQCMGVLKLAQGVLDRPHLPVGPLVGDIHLGALLPLLAVSPPPLEAAMVLAVEEVADLAQPADPAGGPLLVTELMT